jgi:16S rRNA (guanine527-N7)-methyltransferase
LVVGYEGFAKTASSLLGLKLNPHQLEAFDWYASELVEWDRRFNLTAVTDSQGIEVKHFLDSLTCLQAMGPRPTGRVVDVGTGAGFPGLPLKIMCPQLELTLVESIGKKVEFCRHVAHSLGLEGVEIVHDRAERVGHQPEHRGVYDWALARAVASMPVLVEYLLPLLKLGGRVVIQKGETGLAEAHTAEGALRILGGRVDQLISIELPTVVECRYLVVVIKNAATPDKYPRRPGIPAKRPLK